MVARRPFQFGTTTGPGTFAGVRALVRRGRMGRWAGVIGWALLVGACREGGVDDGTVAARMRAHYREEAASASYASVGMRSCGQRSVDELLVTALDEVDQIDSSPQSFAAAVHMALDEGALGLAGLDDRTYWPPDWAPCVREFKVTNGPNGPELVAVVDQRDSPWDVVKMSRCLFKDIDLGFVYRIERMPPDDGSGRDCDPLVARGLCRPACADL